MAPSVDRTVVDLANWGAANIPGRQPATYEARAPQLPELTPLVSHDR
jgi:hypothetical protein